MNKSLYCFYALTSKCNRKCSYCLGGKHKLLQEEKSLYKCVVNKLRSLDLPIQIDLSGGEPTTSPDFDNIVQYMLSELPKLNRIILSTNGNIKYNFKKIYEYAKYKRFLLSITIHLENFDWKLIENIKNIITEKSDNVDIELRIAYLPKKIELIKELVNVFDGLGVYKKLLLYLFDDNINYSTSDVEFLKTTNNRWNFKESVLPSFSNTYCVSAGIAILHNNKFTRCCAGKDFVKKSPHPIFLTTNEEILTPVIYKCTLQHCVTHSECHKNFAGLSDAKNFVSNFKYVR